MIFRVMIGEKTYDEYSSRALADRVKANLERIHDGRKPIRVVQESGKLFPDKSEKVKMKMGMVFDE